MRQLTCIVTVVMAIGLITAPVFGQNQSTEKKKEITSSERKTESKETAKTTGAYLRQKKERYQKKAEEQLHRFEDKLKRLYAKAEKKSVKARETFSRAADDLKEKSDSAKNKLKDLKESGEETWDHARAELDLMLRDLERTYNRTAARIKD